MKNPPGSHREEQPRRSWRASDEALVALLLYVILTALVFAPLLSGPRTLILADDANHPGEGGAFGSLWLYWSIQKQVASWKEPFSSDGVLPPAGARFGFDTHALVPTLLTASLARPLGTVASYNVMVLGLLISAALMLFAHLRRTYQVPWWIAWLGGACLGLSPPLVAIAHETPSLLGAVFWGGALAVVMDARVRDRYDLRHGVVFACCVWACFWSSLREFGTLVVVIVPACILLELARPGGARRSWKTKLIFFIPLALGSISLMFLRIADRQPITSARVARDIPVSSSEPLFLSIVCVCLAAVAAWGARRDHEETKRVAALGALLGLSVLFVADLPGTDSLLGLLPKSIRPIPQSFVPVALFLVLILAAHGATHLWRRRHVWARVGLALVIVPAITSGRPTLHTSPVRRIYSLVEHGRPDPRWRVLVVPHGRYRDVDDTYQVAVDAPCVYNGFLASRSATYAELARRYPRIYGDFSQTWDAEWGREMKQLDVGYLILSDREQLQALPPELQQSVWMAGPDGYLVSVR